MTKRCESLDCSEPAAWVVKVPVSGFKSRKYYVCDLCHQNHADGVPFVETKRINRSFEQVKCPTCKLPILVPEITFNSDDDRVKRRRTVCVQCCTIVSMYMQKEGEIEVFRERPCYIYPEVPDPVSATGIQPTTEIYIHHDVKQNCYVAAVGIAMMGTTNFPGSVGACPFDLNFHDNAVYGKGDSPAEAVAAMVEDMKKMAEGLWA